MARLSWSKHLVKLRSPRALWRCHRAEGKDRAVMQAFRHHGPNGLPIPKTSEAPTLCGLNYFGFSYRPPACRACAENFEGSSG